MEVSDLITARWKPHRDTSDLRPTCTTAESNDDICIYIYIERIREDSKTDSKLRTINRGQFRVFAKPFRALIGGEFAPGVGWKNVNI